MHAYDNLRTAEPLIDTEVQMSANVLVVQNKSCHSDFALMSLSCTSELGDLLWRSMRGPLLCFQCRCKVENWVWIFGTDSRPLRMLGGSVLSDAAIVKPQRVNHVSQHQSVRGFCCNLIRPDESCSAKDSLTGDSQNVSRDLVHF